MKRKSETQKILAVRDYHKGKKVADICREYNCAKSTFYTWVRPYTEKKNKYGTVKLKDLQLANDRIRKLENELEIIHNSSFFKELTLKDKKAGIDEQYGKYSVVAYGKVKPLPPINILCDNIVYLILLFGSKYYSFIIIHINASLTYTF